LFIDIFSLKVGTADDDITGHRKTYKTSSIIVGYNVEAFFANGQTTYILFYFDVH